MFFAELPIAVTEKIIMSSLARSASTVVCREFCSHIFKYFKNRFQVPDTWPEMTKRWKYGLDLEVMLDELGKLSVRQTSMVPDVRLLHHDIHRLQDLPLNQWPAKFDPDLDNILPSSITKGSVFLHATCWKLEGNRVQEKWNPTDPKEQDFKQKVVDIVERAIRLKN